MAVILSERHPVARKGYTCDSCMGPICVGERYYYQTNTIDGFSVWRSHLHCERASQIVAAELDWPDLEDGMPRVCDMEREDREHIAAVDPETYVAIWGTALRQDEGGE